VKRLTLVSLVSLAALVTALAAAADVGIPRPKPADLAKPFVGAPVSHAWLGAWKITNPGDGYGVLYRFYSASSPWCRSITAGRTSCFTLQPPGHLELWAGSVTLAGGKVILRMTYKPRPNTFGCFADDAYPYRIAARTIKFLKGSSHACFFDQANEFPVTLVRQPA
jgi:hypothetical protein